MPHLTPIAAPHILAAGLALSLSAAAALAQPVLITSPTTVGPLDTEIMSSDGTLVPLDTAEITVQGTTLTINGRHDIAWLALESSATVTHDVGFVFDYSMGAGTDIVSGLDLAVVGDVLLTSGTQISVNGLGFGSDVGPGAGQFGNRAGGGGYGGQGGNGPEGAGGEAYGSVLEPVDFGSGGGSDIDAGIPGRPGGGAIRLIVGGTLTLDGVIESNGLSRSSAEEGGGAGGSIWIDATSLSGIAGTIRANGGNGRNESSGRESGGGSGGRVAIYTDSTIPLALASRIQTWGGTGRSQSRQGAAGTVYLEEAGNTTLIIDNNGRDARVTTLSAPVEFPSVIDELIVGNFGKIAPVAGEPFYLEVLENAEISTNSLITATGLGFGSDVGPGAGEFGNRAGGGGHGGQGGNGIEGAGGEAYGSVFEPVAFGSGGGSDIDAGIPGRPGGGAIRLIVGGTLTLDGVIESNGLSRSSAEEGGGAGGSIWLEAASLAGVAGTIRANGGNGRNESSGRESGGGSGGRVAIYTDSAIPVALATRIQTWGGTGRSQDRQGAAGTVYLEEAGNATLIIDNNGRDARVTTLGSSSPEVGPDGVYSLTGSLLVRGSGTRFGPQPGEFVHFDIDGDMSIGGGSFFTADAAGFASNMGPGAGVSGTRWGGGAGHGGTGGDGRSDDPAALGGMVYGLGTYPTTLGSGGGRDPDGGALGGAGGGAFRLSVSGTLEANGDISASARAGTGQEAGGGSGGSIWVEAGAITGVSTFRANGGTGASAGGGGSGGYIAVYSCDIAPTITMMASGGGSGTGQAGEAGSTLFGSGSVSFAVQPDPSVLLVPGDTLELSVEASGGSALLYQWRRNGEDLINGGRVSGARSDMLVITSITDDDAGRYEVFVTDICGPRPSMPSFVSVECRADIDGDGELTIFDFLAFQNLFDAGDLEADFDGDGQLTIFDFLAFQNEFDAGCA